MERTMYILMRLWCCPICTRPTC